MAGCMGFGVDAFGLILHRNFFEEYEKNYI